MGFSSAIPSVGGVFRGADPTRLQEESWDAGQGPVYGGGFRRGGLADMYRKEEGKTPFSPQHNPYFDKWSQEEQGRQLADRQQLSDLYNQLNAQAHGAMTPQQQQQIAQQGAAAQLQQNMANSAAGGAYAQSAARGALLQNRGIQGAVDTQQQQQLKAADMMSATAQMQKVAQMQRAQDLQSQGLSMEDAFRQAEQEAKARGMNISREVGYAGLEQGSIANDYAMYQDALRRAAAKREQDIKHSQEDTAMGMNIGGQIVGGIGKMFG